MKEEVVMSSSPPAVQYQVGTKKSAPIYPGPKTRPYVTFRAH